MKNLSLLILSILIILGCNPNQPGQPKPASKSAIDTPETPVTTDAEEPRTQSQAEPATLNGSLCYPSEYIPAMTVYLKDITSGKTYSLQTKKDQKEFKFTDIPAGDYYAYAYTIEKLASDDMGVAYRDKGGYTQAVPCGLTYQCKDHSLLKITLTGGTHAQVIEVCDWYGAEVPPEE